MNCYDCQYRSKIDSKFCYNYMMLIKESKPECDADNRREVILMQTKDRNWLTVDEITELKATEVMP